MISSLASLASSLSSVGPHPSQKASRLHDIPFDTHAAPSQRAHGRQSVQLLLPLLRTGTTDVADDLLSPPCWRIESRSTSTSEFLADARSSRSRSGCPSRCGAGRRVHHSPARMTQCPRGLLFLGLGGLPAKSLAGLASRRPPVRLSCVLIDADVLLVYIVSVPTYMAQGSGCRLSRWQLDGPARALRTL